MARGSQSFAVIYTYVNSGMYSHACQPPSARQAHSHEVCMGFFATHACSHLDWICLSAVW